MTVKKRTLDANEAVARVAYAISEICSIYPITPSSPMAELADVWSASGKENIWGHVPDIIEMQSEGGAAGTAHGALQTGALTTTFTASQGLMLMLPNMYKIAGELTSAVFHVASRSLAAQALSIFGDHQDVMAARTTGFGLLAASSVQAAQDLALVAHAATLESRVPFIHFFDGFRTSHEVNKIDLLAVEQIRAMINSELVYAHRKRALNPDNPFIRGTAQNPDVYFQGRESVNRFYQARSWAASSVQAAQDLALVAHAATLESRVPFIHFFDGFRTSHEVNKIDLLAVEQIRAMINSELVYAHRKRALNPDNPFIRGTAQNPDVYFQGRESVNRFYQATPGIVQQAMDRFAELTGRPYRLFDYHGDPEAERIIVLMGSGADTVMQTIDALPEKGLGLVNVRLYRPFSGEHLLAAIPDSARSIAVLDRTKEIGAAGEPLYQDTVTVLAEAAGDGRLISMPKIIGGRYGLSSKEFTPAMVKTIFDELKKPQPKNHFTIGIHDDVTHTSLDYDSAFEIESDEVTRALFFGLGSDGTVGANKNSIKIIGENTDLYCQGYFVYDSKKSGSQTVSHLRFGPEQIHAPYLIQSANFIACHKFNLIDKIEVLRHAAAGSVFLLNSPYSSAEVWDKLPRPVQEAIVGRGISFSQTSVWVPMARSAPTKTASRSSARIRIFIARVTSCTTRRNQVHRLFRICALGLSKFTRLI